VEPVDLGVGEPLAASGAQVEGVEIPGDEVPVADVDDAGLGPAGGAGPLDPDDAGQLPQQRLRSRVEIVEVAGDFRAVGGEGSGGVPPLPFQPLFQLRPARRRVPGKLLIARSSMPDGERQDYQGETGGSGECPSRNLLHALRSLAEQTLTQANQHGPPGGPVAERTGGNDTQTPARSAQPES
jgi:hypothetical protein